jgi:endonuclease YncB( thermonuclease family)
LSLNVNALSLHKGHIACAARCDCAAAHPRMRMSRNLSAIVSAALVARLFNVAALVTYFCIVFGGSAGAALFPSAAHAANDDLPTVKGHAHVIGGDTLVIDKQHIRLVDIDAYDKEQTCADGWPVGKRATERMIELTLGTEINCQIVAIDKYQRLVGVCWGEPLRDLKGKPTALRSLNMEMVLNGLARIWPYAPVLDGHMAEVEARARYEKNGAWAHDCKPPWEHRKEQRK